MIRKLRVTAVAVAAIAVAAPGVADASRGTVLKVDRSHKVVRALTGKHISALHYRGHLSRHVRPGTRLRFVRSGRFATHMRSLGHEDSATLPITVGDTPVNGLNISLGDVPDGSKVVLHFTFTDGVLGIVIDVVQRADDNNDNQGDDENDDRGDAQGRDDDNDDDQGRDDDNDANDDNGSDD